MRERIVLTYTGSPQTSMAEYAHIVSSGLWFTAERGTLDALNAKVQE